MYFFITPYKLKKQLIPIKKHGPNPTIKTVWCLEKQVSTNKWPKDTFMGGLNQT